MIEKLRIPFNPIKMEITQKTISIIVKPLAVTNKLSERESIVFNLNKF